MIPRLPPPLSPTQYVYMVWSVSEGSVLCGVVGCSAYLVGSWAYNRAGHAHYYAVRTIVAMTQS